MRSRTKSPSTDHTTSPSSSKYIESSDSSRHSSPSLERQSKRSRNERRRTKNAGIKRKLSEDSIDDSRFYRRNDEYSRRRSPKYSYRHRSSSQKVIHRPQGTSSRKEHRRRSSSSNDRKRTQRSPYTPESIEESSIKKEQSSDDECQDSSDHNQNLRKRTAREDALWADRRNQRDKRCEWGVRSVWGRSPLMHEIHAVYEEYERLEEERRQEEEQLPQPLNFTGIKVTKKSKKEKKERKKKRKEKKKRKKKHEQLSSNDEDEWVEVTAEMRKAEAAREKLEEAEMVGPIVPDHLQLKHAALVDTTKRVNYGKDMLRGEAAAMASYIAQGKRIPRRGEIGLSSAEISEYEKIGYVMSGTRHKSMEATRLRKENQVMTAEEKRLLSGFTHDERKKKEEIVLQQFKSFIESKKGKN
ncbi:unnamed protein product [Thelazia callipaeda]|uniref:Nkap_C domain-containing protein n=1 Tax=Thelazia callipaeda TaxID=103827 RepID=A0A158RB26_THECL|nr:unnamed protein product [Thelazia callipaeda]